MRIRYKLLFFVIPLATLPLILLGVFSYRFLSQGFEEQSYLDDQNLCLMATMRIEQVLDHCRDGLLMLSTQLFSRFDQIGNESLILNEPSDPIKKITEGLALRFSPYLQVRFIAPNGKELFKTVGLISDLKLETALDEPIFLQAVAIGDWRWSRPVQFPPISQDQKTWTSTFSLRLAKDFNLLGFIFIDLNLEALSKILNDRAKSQQGYYFLFDGAGRTIASGGDNSMFQSNEMREKINAIMRRMSEQEETAFVHKDFNIGNQKYFLSYRPVKEYIAFLEPIPEERWYLGLIRSETPIRAAFRRTQIVFLILLGLGLGIAVLGAFYIAKKITTPIGRLMLATQKFAKGDLDSQIETASQDEIGQLAADFNKMAKDLKRMMLEVDIHKNLAAIGKFAAAMYHDLKSPIEGLKLLTSGMKRKINEDDPQKHYVDEIVIGVETLDQRIHETLDFVKPKTMNRQLTDLNELLQSVVQESKITGVEFDWNLATALPEVAIDPFQIKHAIINLINNALEAMADKGQIKISTNFDAGIVTLEILDTGIGIKPEELEHIFQPFYSTKQKGHGLGLSIVHQIIRDHGGEIVVESEVGKGTKVKVKLPVRKDLPHGSKTLTEE